jgi:signal transduction histidine kinase
MWATLVLSLIFAAWSVKLLVEVNRHRSEIEALSPVPHELGAEWRQLYPVALVSSVLAVVAAALLLLRQREVWQRRISEREISRHNEILQSILRNIGEGVVVADEQGRFILFNPTAEKIIGIGVTDSRPDEWSKVYGLFRPDGETPLTTEELPLARAVEGHPSHEVPIFVRNENVPNGVLISVTATPLRDSQGALRGGVAVLRDVTERREAEAARWARELASHLQAAREDERRALAREIHDELGQALTGLKLEASFLLRRTEHPQLRERLERMSGLIDDTIGAVRRMAAELRPPILDELGLIEAIRWQAGEFQARTGIPCELDLPLHEAACSQEVATAMFRILQESLTNVARHAGASRVWIRVDCRSQGIVLEVSDDGRGIAREKAASPRSFGLIGMRERARMLGGDVTIGLTRAGGTLVRAEIPAERVAGG